MIHLNTDFGINHNSSNTNVSWPSSMYFCESEKPIRMFSRFFNKQQNNISIVIDSLYCTWLVRSLFWSVRFDLLYFPHFEWWRVDELNNSLKLLCKRWKILYRSEKWNVKKVSWKFSWHIWTETNVIAHLQWCWSKFLSLVVLSG